MERAFFKVRLIEIEFPDHKLGLGQLEKITSGWVVKTELKTFEGERGMYEAFELASNTTGTVEGFKDGDTELWNVIEVFDNEAEATQVGKDYNQLYIYQIETSTFKWL